MRNQKKSPVPPCPSLLEGLLKLVDVGVDVSNEVVGCVLVEAIVPHPISKAFLLSTTVCWT